MSVIQTVLLMKVKPVKLKPIRDSDLIDFV